MSETDDVNTLRRQVAAARKILVQQFNDGIWGRADLNEALAEAGMAPFGSVVQREVTVAFTIGFENEDEALATTSGELNSAVESMFECINEDGLDFSVPETDAYTVRLGPIQRGNLPS